MSEERTFRSALITGGARGIGKATAIKLARSGCGVVVLDRDPEALTAAGVEFEDHDVEIHCVAGDVVSRADVRSALDRCAHLFGPVDALVSNAGLADITPLLEITDESWERVLAVNLTGTFRCSQEAGRRMAACGRGTIVIVSSTNAFYPEQNLAAYNAAKAGALNFVRAAALDLAPLGVRVNGVAPGMVLTEGSAWLTEDPDLGPAYLDTIPTGRFALPDDVADVVAFLLSDASRHMTGQTLVIDGGHSLGVMFPKRHVSSPWGGAATDEGDHRADPG